jgi:alpha-galactosidase
MICGLFSALILASSSLMAEKPVKVYVLAGQSNMVGIGQTSPAGRTAYSTYVSAEDKSKEAQGCIISIYSGAYDPDVDYSKKEPVKTQQVRVGYWPHTAFAEIEGEQTQIARGFIHIDQPGRYTFRSANGSICKVNGKMVYDNMSDNKAEPEIVRYETGSYPIEVIFNGVGRTNLSYNFYDLPGSLYTVVKEQGNYPHLLNKDGEWASRDDVWYKGVVTATADKWLSVGCGASKSKIGPELGFGWVLGNYHDEPVLLIKASQGNRSLAWDFAPPSSERFEFDGKIYAGYKDSPSSWEKGTVPEPINWYAGKQYDDCFNATKEVLANFDEKFPQWAERGYEINGFVWWQGHKDSGSEVYASRYEQNLVQLIESLRKEFDAPEAPFIVGTIGFHGWDMPEQYLPIANAQLAVSDYSKYPAFKDNVHTVETRDFWRPAELSPRNQDYHYNQNGETYYLIGEAFGKGMIKLLEGK